MLDLRGFVKELSADTFSGKIRFNEPLSAHTTFKVGGPADVWIQPAAEVFTDYAAVLLTKARSAGVPVFILGGGANIVPSDEGFRGVVLDTGGYAGLAGRRQLPDGQWETAFRAGGAADAAVEIAADAGLGGLEFLAGMPGTIGGAVYMNARCYEKSLSDCLIETVVLELEDGFFKKKTIPFCASGFGYKKSPFQNTDTLILEAKFALYQREKALIRQETAAYYKDREDKGHYRFPSAGSVFKNNRAFGKPAGKIIDELGLRGLTCGGAMVAPFHGNIIVNTGGATADGIRFLVDKIQTIVREKTGFILETEIIFVKSGGSVW